MAVTGQISSTFHFYITNDSGTAFTVINPGRTFTVVAVMVANSNAAARTIRIRKNSNTGTDLLIATGGSAGEVDITANAQLLLMGPNAGGGAVGGLNVGSGANYTASDNFYIDTEDGDVSPIIIYCQGNPAKSLTVS
jgi:hypothetical protein